MTCIHVKMKIFRAKIRYIYDNFIVSIYTNILLIGCSKIYSED